MEMNSILWKVISGILGLISIILLGVLIFTNNQSKTTLRNEQLKTTAVEKKLSKVTEEYEYLEKQKIGAVGKDLVSKTNKFFNILSVYDTSKGGGLVSTRKKQMSKLTTPETLESIFPENSDKGRPTVKTVSKLLKKPEIYLMPSESKIKTTLVVVDYGLSVADSELLKSRFLYRLEFNPIEGVFTKYENLGSLDTNG